MWNGLSVEFQRLRTQIYTFVMIFVVVKFFPISVLKIAGVEIELSEANRTVVETSLALVIFFSVFSAVICLIRDKATTDLEIPRVDPSEVEEKSRKAKPAGREFIHKVDKYQRYARVSYWCEAIFPLLFGGAAVSAEIFTIISNMISVLMK